jgi:hypothetical protein
MNGSVEMPFPFGQFRPPTGHGGHFSQQSGDGCASQNVEKL